MLNNSKTVYQVEYTKVLLQDGSTYLVPKYARHRYAAQSILSGQYYEPETHRIVSAILCNLGGNMIHAGTFFGDMIPSFSRATSGQVFAFEPVLENYILAKLCIEENNLGNVYLLNAALGDAVGVTHVTTQDADGSHLGGASQISDLGQTVAMITIDSLNIEHINLIQLDVEGFEYSALKGAEKTLLRDSPIVMIEDNLSSCCGYLEQLEYSYFGSIPGLSIWCRANHLRMLASLL